MNDLRIIAPENQNIRPADRPLRVLGIDLGTTNSAVAEIVLEPGSMKLPPVECLEVEQETLLSPYYHNLVPSVVALHNGGLLVGEGAKRLRSDLSERGLEQNRDIFWECKNEIGVRRTYHKAPDGFSSAKEISGHILKFLMDAALAGNSDPDSTVVTVPASFQAPQRQDTIEAAEMGGIRLEDGALLDEPIAAFIAYLTDRGRSAFAEVSGPRRLLVFDFGGGTCDVALFELLPPKAQGRPIRIAPLSVSRYHRLGGGDIDREIVVNVLIPQLIEQNRLDENELDYQAKSRFVIPALLGVAENLKIGLSKEIARLKKLGEYAEERETTFKELARTYECSLKDGKKLTLKSPKLTAAQLEEAVKPFLDRDLLHPREFDYHMTCSIFAPLQDALDRASVARGEVNYCLLVGGSSAIPQVAEAVEQFFSEAQFLRFDDPERIHTAVAEGAAYQALSLELFGQGIVHPVASGDIRIQTSDGPKRLIERGAELPFPSESGWAEHDGLTAPTTAIQESAEIRVALTDSRSKTLANGIWRPVTIIHKGDPLRLRYRMDLNQKLSLELELANEPEGDKYSVEIENPLTHIVNPNLKREQVLELEEKMRVGGMTLSKQKETTMKIASLEADLGQREKALSLLNALNRHSPDASLLNRMGLLCDDMRDYERAEKYYFEAARMNPNWGIPLFNLALEQERQGKLEDAEENIINAIKRTQKPPYKVLQAMIISKQGRDVEGKALMIEALDSFDPLQMQTDWELGWYASGARFAGDDLRVREVEAEKNRRRSSTEWDAAAETEGDLPDYADAVPVRSE